MRTCHAGTCAPTSDLADANIVDGTVKQDFDGVLYDVPVLTNHKELLAGQESQVHNNPDSTISNAIANPNASALQRTASVATGYAVAM